MYFATSTILALLSLSQSVAASHHKQKNLRQGQTDTLTDYQARSFNKETRQEVDCTTSSSDVYKQSDGILGTSGAGGLCICPSGATYIVADNYDGCQSLQCEGGTSVPICNDPDGKILDGFQFASKYDKRGWGVVCDGDDEEKKREYTFERMDEHMSWNDHHAQARAFGCSLASILDEEEQAEVEDLFSDGIDERIWIGASRTGPGVSDWEWSDGSVFGYTNWQEGEPNNSGEDGALMDTRPIGERYWNDVSKKFEYSAVYKCPLITSKAWRIRNAGVSSSNAWALRGLQFCEDANCESVYSPVEEFDDGGTPSWSSPSFLFDSDTSNLWKSFHGDKVGSAFVGALFDEPASVAAIGIRPDNVVYGISDLYVEYLDENEEWKTLTTLTNVPKHYGDINSGGPTYPNDVWYVAELPGYPTPEAPPSYSKIYTKQWPHCDHIDEVGCLAGSRTDLEEECNKHESCTGFSFSTGSTEGWGCLKNCGSDDSFNGYGYGSHDYWMKN